MRKWPFLGDARMAIWLSKELAELVRFRLRGVVAGVRDQERLILSVECLGRAMITIDSSMVKKEVTK